MIFSLPFCYFLNSGDTVKKSIKQRYLTSAFILLLATVIVKIISAFYKIPLTAYIGAEGRGYFSIAYNLCMPIHALTMGAFPIALTKLVSSYDAKGDSVKIKALRKASKRLFLIIGLIGLGVMLIFAKPYANLISSSPKSIYTILALAPSVFFSCIGASHRAFAEGFLDMKATALSQLLEALIKMIFGLLFAKYTMSGLYEFYLLNGTVLGVNMADEGEALSAIYPLTSAAAMLGVTLGSIVAYFCAMIYTNTRYGSFPCERSDVKSAYNELLIFSASLVGATVIQSLSNFLDTSSIQYFLSLCNETVLKNEYSYTGEDVHTYVFGIYATVLDFRNLVPSIVMALGVAAVPAVSAAYENSSQRFSALLTSIFKYASVLSVAGGLVLTLFGSEILSIFYSSSHPDIVENAGELMFYTGVFILPFALATTTVYSVQALGFAKSTIPAFIISSVLRIIANYLLITNESVNINGTAFSTFMGFFAIVIMNLVTIKKKTNAKISYFNVFVKPIFCGIIVYFAVQYIKSGRNLTLYQLMLLAVLCILFYSILLILTKTVTLREKIKS